MKLPKKILLIIYLVMVVVGGIFLYFKRPFNSELVYWDYMISQDPKPKDISETEYFLGNQKGICWRNNKIHSKQELNIHSMRSLVDILLKEIELERNGHVPNAVSTQFSYYHGTDSYCKKNQFNCKLWLIKYNLSFNNAKLYWHDLFKTTDKVHQFISSKNSFLISDISLLENSLNKSIFIRTSFFGDEVYPSDCCKVIDKKEFDLIRNKKIIFESHDKTLNNQFKGKLPYSELKQYGIGDFYFMVKTIKFSHIKNVELYESNHIYFINNCGDLLIKPYFSANS